MTPEYRFAFYSERCPSVPELTALTEIAFAEYQGVIIPTDAHTDWYVRRPGFDDDLSGAAWLGDDLVAGLFLTRSRMLVSEEVWDYGLLDTVMTHPDHRGQGLARALLEQCITACQDRGPAVLQLYTTPGSAGYRIYSRLGFRPLVELDYWIRPPAPAGQPVLRGWSPADGGDDAIGGRIVDSLARVYEGVPEANPELWRWRRVSRPPAMPATVWVRDEGSSLETVTTSPLHLRGIGPCLLLSDLVVTDVEAFSSLCAHLGGELQILAVADRRDKQMATSLLAAGFRRGQSEVAMFLDLQGHSSAGLPGDAGLPWLPLTESIIGA